MKAARNQARFKRLTNIAIMPRTTPTTSRHELDRTKLANPHTPTLNPNFRVYAHRGPSKIERERESRDIGQSPESATEKSGPRINGCD
jgi:hypothetical protein